MQFSIAHGSIAEYKGQWFAFYHNQSISGKGNLRSVCVDRLYHNEDGSICEVVQREPVLQTSGE